MFESGCEAEPIDRRCSGNGMSTRAVVSFKENSIGQPDFGRPLDQDEGLVHERLKLDLKSRVLKVVP
jgi:hypothetical protein